MSTCLLTGLKFATRIKVTFIHKKSEMLKVVTPRVKVNVNSLKDGSESWAFVFQDCLDWKTLGPTRMEDWNLRGLKGLKRLLLVTALLAKLCRLLMQRLTFSDDQTEMLDFFAKKSVTKRCVQWTGRVRRSTMNIGPLHRHSSYLNDQNTIELLNRTWSLVALHWTWVGSKKLVLIHWKRQTVIFGWMKRETSPITSMDLHAAE